MNQVKLASIDHNHDLISLHKNLIECPSVSSNAVGEYLDEYLSARDFVVERQILPDGNFNVFAYKGRSRNTRVLLTSHIDTVPPFFPYRIEGDRIYGRGSVDDKNCVAAQIVAFQELWRDKSIKDGDLALLFVVGEETGGHGMTSANELFKPDKPWSAVIFGEPTECKLSVGHKGVVMAKISVHGKAAHSGYPEKCISAIDNLVETLMRLKSVSWPRSELLGNSTYNIGKISGGVANNIISPYAEATILVRVAADAQKIASILKSFEMERNDGLKISIDVFHVSDQVFLTHDVPGFQHIVCSYGTDVPYLSGTFKRYLYGPGSILEAHSADEFVTVSDLYQGVHDYKKLVLSNLE